MFEVAEAYERQRGRSSKLLAPLFVDFVGVQGEVLDVGCGTGALTFAIAQNQAVSKIVAVDVSEAFLGYARYHTDDPRISFELGDVQNLRFPDASFDQCLALLVMRFIPDPPKAAREMRRVTRPGGVVATAMWDTTGDNELINSLWDAALSLDYNAPQDKNKLGVYGTAQGLISVWTAADIRNIEVKNIVFPCGFESFDDFWKPLTEGQGPAGVYLRRISEDNRKVLRDRLRQNLFGSCTDGPFTLKAKAWAVRGTVP
jgi:SAM-dependent methyltransferase